MLSRLERYPPGWEKIFAYHISNKSLIYEIYNTCKHILINTDYFDFKSTRYND